MMIQNKIMALKSSIDVRSSMNQSSVFPVCKARSKLYMYKQTSLPLPRLSGIWMDERTRYCKHIVEELTGSRNSINYVFSPFIKYHRSIFPPREWAPEYYRSHADPLVHKITIAQWTIRKYYYLPIIYRIARKNILPTLLVLLSIGFTAYISLMPGAVVGWPEVLKAGPDLEELLKIAMDTYDRYICSEHNTSAPCHCPRGINRALPIFMETTELPCDPLNLTVDMPRRMRGVAIYIGMTILLLSLGDKSTHIERML